MATQLRLYHASKAGIDGTGTGGRPRLRGGPRRATLFLALISAAEEVHLATLDLLDAKLAVSEARTEQLQIEDRSLNYEA